MWTCLSKLWIVPEQMWKKLTGTLVKQVFSSFVHTKALNYLSCITSTGTENGKPYGVRGRTSCILSAAKKIRCFTTLPQHLKTEDGNQQLLNTRCHFQGGKRKSRHVYKVKNPTEAPFPTDCQQSPVCVYVANELLTFCQGSLPWLQQESRDKDPRFIASFSGDTQAPCLHRNKLNSVRRGKAWTDLHDRKQRGGVKLSILAGPDDQDAGNSLTDTDSGNKISRDLQLSS